MNAFTGTFNEMNWNKNEEGVIASGISKWMEPNGKFGDHIIYIEEIDADTFRWSDDLSWDGGKTWIKGNQVQINRRIG